MFRKLEKWLDIRVNTKDDLVSEWHWRKKYNTLLGELEVMKEIMADEIYQKTIKEISRPLEIAGYKRTIKRLNGILDVVREERNTYIKENAELKKLIRSLDAKALKEKKLD